MSPPVRITVLISGNGSNLQALIDAIGREQLPATIVRVICNRKEAYGLVRASKASIPVLYHNLVKYKKKHPATDEGHLSAREEYDAELATLVLGDRPELVACLGFMHVVSTKFLEPLERAGVQIINLHPALPGKFNGAMIQNALRRAHEAWRKGKIDKTGVMIHKVIAEVDMGTPILVREIPFLSNEDDDLEAFEQRVHRIEWDVVVEGTGIALGNVLRNRS